MKIEALVKMANQIAAFFDGEGGHNPKKPQRWWRPTCAATGSRACVTQMIDHLQSRGGDGLDELARKGVALLAAGKV